MPVPRTCLTLLAAMAAVLVGGAPAWAQQPSWSLPDTVPGSEGGGTPVVDASAAGTALAFLRPRAGGDDADVLVSRRSGFGAWVTAGVSDPGAPTLPDVAPALAISRSGAVAAAWLARPPDSDDDPRIDLVVGNLAGDLQRHTIAAAALGRDASNVTITVDDAGEAVLGWTITDGRGTRSDEDDVIRARSLLVDAAGTPGPAVELSTPADGDITELRSCSTPAGDVVFGWVATHEQESTSARITTTTTGTSVAGALGRPGSFQPFALPAEATEVVSVNDNNDAVLTVGERFAQVRVGVADDGRALLSFQRFRSDDQDEPDRPIDVTRIETLLSAGSIAGGLAPAVVFGDAARPDDEDELALTLDVGAGGQATVAGLAGLEGHDAFAAKGDVTGAFAAGPALGAADEVDAAARGLGHTVAVSTGAAGIAAALDGLPPQPIAPLDAFPKSPAVTGLGEGSAVAVWQLDPLPLPMNVGDESIRFADLVAPAASSLPAPPPPPPPPPPATPAPAPPAPAAPPPPAAPAPQLAASSQPPEADVTVPEIDNLSLSPEVYLVGPGPSPFAAPRLSRSALRARSAKAPLSRGGALTFALSESAWMRFTISRMVTKHGGRSRCPKAHRRRGGPVRRVGVLERTFPAGPQALAVSGRIRRGALSRGRYTLRARAVDPAGNLSKIVAVRFTIC